MEKGKGILLEWEMYQDFQDHEIWVERAGKGEFFQPIANLKSTSKKGEIQKFNYTDVRPFAGRNAYRLKFVNLEGEENWSQIIDIEYFMDNDLTLVNTYPNPASKSLKLELTAHESFNVRFQLISNLGKSILVRNLNLSVGRNLVDLDLTQFPEGIYLYTIQSPTTAISGKFIKK